jgi:hypothetical protein
MHTVAERNMLLRARTKLPDGLELSTDEFREGWELVRTLDARRLEKKIALCGWNIIKISEELLRSGVGETSKEAIANALKLSLRRINEHFNAVEVEHIELTQYPWFFLARIRVVPFRIQQGAVFPVSDKVEVFPVSPRQRRLPVHAEVLYPHFESVIPQLKELLISSRTMQSGPQ